MKRLLLTTLLCTFFVFQATAQITCTVKGTVVDRPESKTIILRKKNQFPLIEGEKIAIQDSTFSFTIRDIDTDIYSLVFQDEKGMMPIYFCTVNGTINMELHNSANSKKNKVKGKGKENKAISDFMAMSDKLDKTLYDPIIEQMNTIPPHEQLSPLGRDIQLRIDTTQGAARNDLWSLWYEKQKTGEIYTPQMRKLSAELDSVGRVIDRQEEKYIRKNPSMFAYCMVKDQLSIFKSFSENYYTGSGSALDFLEGQYKQLAKAYPRHNYTKACKEIISNIRQVYVRSKYIDFSAPDMNGNMIKISDQIEGKIALIDMWASWCGPCRSGSISFMPIYDQYKDHGFTIVGVARENGNDKAMHRALLKDGYKWTNLLEMDDKGGIWEKYGIADSAGGVYMVDRDGTILAINPNAAKVREILEAKIKK